jgi:hypothetical protein
MKEIIFIASGILVTIYFLWSHSRLQQSVRRLGRMLLESEYKLHHHQNPVLAGQKLNFVDAAYELIDVRGALGDPETAGKLLVDWGSSLVEFKEVVSRINKRNKQMHPR